MANFNTVEIDGVGTVLFERSNRAKHVRISVKPFKRVRVAVPEGLSFEKAEEFVHAKTGWIQRHLVRIKQYEEESRLASDTSVYIDRPRAKRKLTRRLKHLALKHGFTYNKVFIRNRKARWGSCSHKNNISLNIKIIDIANTSVRYSCLRHYFFVGIAQKIESGYF